MIRIFLAIVTLIGTVTVAAACPTWEMDGVQGYETDGATLYSPQNFDVIAGGDQSLAECGLDAVGYVITQPDFEFNIAGMDNYTSLMVSVEADCDAVLLINDAVNNILYNDDTNGTDPAIEITDPADGIYDIWVGTFDGNACEAVLTLESF